MATTAFDRRAKMASLRRQRPPMTSLAHVTLDSLGPFCFFQTLPASQKGGLFFTKRWRQGGNRIDAIGL